MLRRSTSAEARSNLGTITPRQRRDGSIGYTAQIRIKRAGKPPYSESQTFDRKAAAVAWVKKREAELAVPGAMDQVKRDDPTLAAVIARYTADSANKMGRTKAQVLKTIEASDFAALPCSAITSERIVGFARSLPASPATTGNYLSHLQAVFSVARPAWGYPLDQQAMTDAFASARRLGYAGKSRQRDRRPTLAELDRLMAFFSDRSVRRASSAPMAHIIAYAIFSARRQEEIVSITWADFEPQHDRQCVRDMKHPGDKAGNDVWCTLTPEAKRLAEAMPRTDERIFPYGTDGVSAAFTRACKVLGIEDLRFHDLRHEAASRLFEMGWTIPRVAEVTGHRGWQSLQRYTHVRQVGDKFEGWAWLDRLTEHEP